MPILGALLAGLFTQLLDFFVKWFSVNVAMRLALGVLIVGAYGILYVAIDALIDGVAVVTPDPIVQGVAMFFPSNVGACMSAVLAADAAATAFRLYVAGLGR